MTQSIDSITSAPFEPVSGQTATFQAKQSTGSTAAFGKSADLSFFNLFQSLQTKPLLQGSITVNQPVETTSEKASTLIDVSNSEAKIDSLLTTQKLDETANISKAHSSTDDDFIWIKQAFGTEESKQMDQWLTHLVQQPQGLPVPWFFQMAEQFNQTSANGQGTSFSGQLMDAITDAFKSGKSIRIALENQTDLILRFSQGKVSAEFMSENPQLQATLQETVAQLRRHLESKELPVGDIVLRDEAATSGQDYASDSETDSENDGDTVEEKNGVVST